MIERMRPMSAEPQDGAAVWVWWREDPSPSPLTFRQGAWEDGDGLKWNVSEAVGWTLRTLRSRRKFSWLQAHESVALDQSVGDFLAIARIAYREAKKRVELVKKGGGK